MFLAQGISTSLLVFPLPCTDETSKRSLYHETKSSTVTIFNWSSHSLPLVKRNLKKWILSAKSSCIGNKTAETFMYGLWCGTEDIPVDSMHVVNRAARKYGDLATLN